MSLTITSRMRDEREPRRQLWRDLFAGTACIEADLGDGQTDWRTAVRNVDRRVENTA